jgi:membrane-associated phospholipid phosphatase
VRVYSLLGDNGVGWVVVAGAVAGLQHSLRPLLITAGLVWAALAVNYAVKSVVRRERPAGAGVPPALIAAPRSHSFPSSHAAMSAAAVFALGPVAVPFALVMMVTRVYLAVHWPSDVLVGAVLGAFVGLAGAMLVA